MRSSPRLLKLGLARRSGQTDVKEKVRTEKNFRHIDRIVANALIIRIGS